MNILRELLTEVKLMDPQFDDWLYRHVENEKIYDQARMEGQLDVTLLIDNDLESWF
jgi:hypothetical protein